MKINKLLIRSTSIILFFLIFINSNAQNHRYGRYNGPRDSNLGFNCLLIGGLIWGLGMLIGLMLKKDENRKIIDGQNTMLGFVMTFCIGGGIIFVFGLIMLGF